MKVILVALNAKYIHSNLAVHSLKAYADQNRCEDKNRNEDKNENISENINKNQSNIEVVEYTINQQREQILESLYKKEPKLLCFSCYIWNLEYVKDLIADFCKLRPEVPIWVGGPEVSYDAATFLQECEGVTGVMVGEGEATFLELVAAYEQSYQKENKNDESSLLEIAGIVYRKNGEIITNPLREQLNMSSLPFCYEELTQFENRIIYYETSRGCPFSCSYCLSSIDRNVRFRDLELVKKELGFFIDNKVRQVKFVDRTFNCNHKHTMEIWNFIKEHDQGVTNFHFEVSADLLNEEELTLIGQLREGLIQLEIGVQSVHLETIAEIRRTMDFEQVQHIVNRIRKGRNVHQHLDLIAGLPKEDYETFQHSFNAVYKIRPEQLQLGFLKVLKGSLMYQNAKEYGLLYQTKAPYEVLATRWLDYSQLLQIKLVEEMVELYYNSGQFVHGIRLLEQLFETPFAMYLALGTYYEKHNLRVVTPSRIKRYDIFLDFVKEHDEAHLKRYEEALLYDLYLRENCKSRPTWKKELSVTKEENAPFKALGKLVHLERFSWDFLNWGEESLLPKEEDTIFLFDYRSKNPLTFEAGVEKVIL